MEGACGKILATKDPAVVIKKIHRRKRAQQRPSSLTAEEQARLQEWAAIVCKDLPLLIVPRAWDAQRFQYTMERIDVTRLLEDPRGHPVLNDLKIFYDRAKAAHIFPTDYELYLQPDGRVAMVDFDKFGTWNDDGSVVFPWGLTMSPHEIQQVLSCLL